MNSPLLDPWFLLDIYETIFRIITGIVFLGIAVEIVSLLFSLSHERLKKQKRTRV